MKNRSFLNDNLDIIIFLIIYSVIAGFLLQYFQYMIAGDEISYIDIARAYATGNWGTAINGYWSPLYSWLLTPFLLFGSNPLYAVYISKIVSLIIGFFTIITVRRLSRTFEIDRNIERSILIALIPSLIFFSLIYPTPDLLLVLFLTYYLSIIFKSEYSNSLINGVICGFVGAAAYLTKSFAFPFFLVHFVLFNMIFFVKGLEIEKKNILKNLFLGLICILCNEWSMGRNYKRKIWENDNFNCRRVQSSYSWSKIPRKYYGLWTVTSRLSRTH